MGCVTQYLLQAPQIHPNPPGLVTTKANHSCTLGVLSLLLCKYCLVADFSPATPCLVKTLPKLPRASVLLASSMPSFANLGATASGLCTCWGQASSAAENVLTLRLASVITLRRVLMAALHGCSHAMHTRTKPHVLTIIIFIPFSRWGVQGVQTWPVSDRVRVQTRIDMRSER